MPRDVAYHEAAIKYNKGMRARARELAKEVGHPDVKRWCRAIAKQHDEHILKHERSLRFLRKQKAKNDKRRKSTGPKPTPPKRREDKTVAEQQAEFAAEKEAADRQADDIEAGVDPIDTGVHDEPAVETTPDLPIEPMDADTNGLGEDPADEKQEASA